MATAKFLPGKLNLSFYRGDDETVEFTMRDRRTREVIDITGYTFAGQARDDAGELVASFTFTVVDAPNGRVDMLAGKTITATFPDFANWDMQVTDSDGDVQTWFAGVVTAQGDITEVP